MCPRIEFEQDHYSSAIWILIHGISWASGKLFIRNTIITIFKLFRNENTLNRIGHSGLTEYRQLVRSRLVFMDSSRFTVRQIRCWITSSSKIWNLWSREIKSFIRTWKQQNLNYSSINHEAKYTLDWILNKQGLHKDSEAGNRFHSILWVIKAAQTAGIFGISF